MPAKDLSAHLFDSGPKRILALDGGGIRGILSLQLLRRIERLVRKRTGNDSAVLSDYFDLIGGTSTGAIIAAALAMGWTVDRLEKLYRELGDSIFESSFFRKGLLRPKFAAGPIRVALEREYGDARLGGPEVVTGLAVVAKRIDTGSPWVLHNNPKGHFYDCPEGSDWVPNKDFLLRDIVRASTAAPTYFEPEKIRVSADLEGAFVDGGVSPHNNPSLQLLMLATLEGHRLQWELGADKLLIVSLGTGSTLVSLDQEHVMKMKPIELGVRGLSSLMDDSRALNELLLQWMSASPTARAIDLEVGDLRGDLLGGRSPMLSYLRYDVVFERDWLDEHLELNLSDAQLASIGEMDRPENMDSLVEVGRAAADSLIDDAHFPSVFDL